MIDDAIKADEQFELSGILGDIDRAISRWLHVKSLVENVGDDELQLRVFVLARLGLAQQQRGELTGNCSHIGEGYPRSSWL